MLPRDQFRVFTHADERVISVQSLESEQQLILVAGQQIVTRENIEVLGLQMTGRIADRISAEQTVQSVLDQGGIPVLAWGFGKWLFGRGRLIRQLLDRFEPAQMALGDSTMRPYGWLTPLIFRAAQRRGFRILHGSDALPFAGEEYWPGRYHSRISIDESDPCKLLPAVMQNTAIELHGAGSRTTPRQIISRLLGQKRKGQ